MTQASIYIIWDTVAQDVLMGAAFLHHHNASAIRMFRDMYADERSPVHKHPEDFELVYLGQLAGCQIRPDSITAEIILTGKQLHASLTQES